MELSTQYAEHTAEMKHYFFKVFGKYFETQNIHAVTETPIFSEYLDITGYYKGKYCTLAFSKSARTGEFSATILSFDTTFIIALEMLIERMHGENITIEKRILS